MALLPQAPAPAAPIRVHTLHPGDVACAERGARLETLLGSCVAIVLTDPRRTVGAMCHVVHSGQGAPRDAVATATRANAYGESALASMYALLVARGIAPALCEAFVYGGGNMFPSLVVQSHVGDDNAQWAIDALARDGVRVRHTDLGGRSYRRLRWTVGPGLPEVSAVEV